MTPVPWTEKAVHRSWQILLASLISGAVAVAASWRPLMFVGAFCGWVLALLALVFALAAMIRTLRVPKDGARVGWLVPSVEVVLCLALLVGHSRIFQAFRTLAEVEGLNNVSAAVLSAFGRSIAEIAKEKGTYPSSLQALVDAGVIWEKDSWSPLDPDLGRSDFSDTGAMRVRSSYIYVRGYGAKQNDPRIILVYEREAFGSVGPLISRKPVRCVLFDDGRVEILQEDAFQRAWQQDRQRRRELGWPIPADELASPPASQAGPVLTWPRT